MNRIEHITLVSRALIGHLELRKSELRSNKKKFLWVKFDNKAFDNKVMSKEEWHDQLIATAQSCGCKYVNVLNTDYDTKIMYFFTNPSYKGKTAMEKLQEASYAR